MSASQSAVRSRAEAVQVSRTLDWMILFTLFTAVLGGYHIVFKSLLYIKLGLF
jgi:methane/ammonia monooxygenase subunit A